MVCGLSGNGKTFLLEVLGQAAAEAGKHVAWFTLEHFGVLIDDIGLLPVRSDAKTLGTATVDRLMHHAHVCQPSSESIRLTQAWPGKE